MRVLLTGATGVVGTELRRRLGGIRDVQLTAVSARGSADGVMAWPMGVSPPPVALDTDWDLVIHTAADTRWNLPPSVMEQANVASTRALEAVIGPRTHLIHLSTLFARGLRGEGSSPQLRDYRNTYEWSKAAADRCAVDRYPAVTVVRPPMIVGRRADGQVARFVGFYTLVKAAMTGLAPLVVAEPEGYLELVSVDDVADEVTARAFGPAPAGATIVSMGRGELAGTVRDTFNTACQLINDWREEHAAATMEPPPLIPPARWERFYRPLADKHLSGRRREALDWLSYFVPYLSITEPFRPTVIVEDMFAALEPVLRFWAGHNRRVALGDARSGASSGRGAR